MAYQTRLIKGTNPQEFQTNVEAFLLEFVDDGFDFLEQINLSQFTQKIQTLFIFTPASGGGGGTPAQEETLEAILEKLTDNTANGPFKTTANNSAFLDPDTALSVFIDPTYGYTIAELLLFINNHLSDSVDGSSVPAILRLMNQNLADIETLNTTIRDYTFTIKAQRRGDIIRFQPFEPYATITLLNAAIEAWRVANVAIGTAYVWEVSSFGNATDGYGAIVSYGTGY